MSAIASRNRSVGKHRTLRRALCVASLFLLVTLSTTWLPAQDPIVVDRELAHNAALYQIAVTQAAQGDIQGAKRTAWQIVDNYEGQRGPAEVTGVTFLNGQPIYYCPLAPCTPYQPHLPPAPPAPSPPPPPQPQPQAAIPRPVQQVSYSAPAPRDFTPMHGPLPQGYLAANPRHGALVDFIDDVDSHGTRVTARKYADGYSVIETLPRTRPAADVAARY